MVEKRKRISYYLPPELIEAVNAEALEAAPTVTSGRVFNPSAVVERILREHYEGKRKKPTRGK